ncbi:neurotrophin receptor-interacting factor homolog [Sardina pilchardus]|uniref:neurotrophin receptor-interacting factor homolog n=1 Tax=Sardina pilchardus TaxID=27697 RepID=UPI002E0FA42A
MAPKKRTIQPEVSATGGEEAFQEDPELADVVEDASLQDLWDLIRTYMAQQQPREDRMEQEASRQWRTIQHQFSLLQREVQERTTPDPGEHLHLPPSHGLEGSSAPSRRPAPPLGLPHFSGQVRDHRERDPRLQPLRNSDDLEHYLITFERVAVACQTTDWAVRLVALLTGKARAAYVSMDQEDSLDYRHLKAAILGKYEINQEAYRQQFRSAQVGEDETPKELYVRRRDLYYKWVQPEHHTKEEIGEVVILEQFLRLLSPELQVWLRERNAASAADAAVLADVFVSARSNGRPWTYAKWKGSRESNRPHHRPHSGEE